MHTVQVQCMCAHICLFYRLKFPFPVGKYQLVWCHLTPHPWIQHCSLLILYWACSDWLSLCNGWTHQSTDHSTSEQQVTLSRHQTDHSVLWYSSTEWTLRGCVSKRVSQVKCTRQHLRTSESTSNSMFLVKSTMHDPFKCCHKYIFANVEGNC